jgi:hypothetical protein
VEIRNDTPLVDGLAIGAGPDRSPHLAVVLKGTFAIPGTLDAPLAPADEQLPLVTGDEFFDGDVLGSLAFEPDVCAFKPRADVAVIGNAHAPGGRPAAAVDVALRVGRYEWALRVTGNRQWLFPSRAVLVPLVSEPQPFKTMPLRFERSYGGFDHRGRSWCAENPIGRGYIGRKTRESVHESLLPNVEHPQHLIRSWDDRPSPAGFGFVRRDWSPRARLAGSVAGAAEADPVLGLPSDFDPAFFNGAHPDLQIPYLKGDEVIELQHLTADGYRRFKLPGWRPAVTLQRFTDGRTWNEVLADAGDSEPERPTTTENLSLQLDTLVVIPDEDLLYLVWRGAVPLPALDLEVIAGAHITMQTA